MQTFRELIGLTRLTLALWWAKLPVLGFWLCLGWAGRELAIHASVRFSTNAIPATLAYSAALVWWVVAIVLMLHSVAGDRDGYRYAQDLALVSVDPNAPQRTRRDVVVDAVVPFMLVYAAWGLAEEHVNRVFQANMAYHGADALGFSITYTAWATYLGIAVVGWLALGLLEIVARKRTGLLIAIMRIALRGTVIVTGFMGFGSLLARIHSWAMNRQFWGWGRNLWEGLLGMLPDWQLWWDQSVPEAVRKVAGFVTDDVWPGLWESVAMPLVWLALTATVIGWSDFRRGVAAGRLASALSSGAERVRGSRLGRGVAAASGQGPLQLVRGWLVGQFEDLLPAAQALRMIVRSGIGFVAAYLLLGALVRLLPELLADRALWLVGPREWAATMVYLPLLSLLGEFLGWTLAVAFYAVAFDRAMTSVMARQQLSQAAGSAPHPAVS